MGRALALSGRGEQVRELAEGDRRLLLHLADQVSRLATRLERLEEDRARQHADRLEAPALAFRGADESGLVRAGPGHAGRRAPRLPDARLVRRILRQRQQRATYLGADLFGDPAWDMTPKIFEKSI